MRSTTSEKIIERLEEIFTTHGFPLSVTSDNGPQFRSDVFERYLEDHPFMAPSEWGGQATK